MQVFLKNDQIVAHYNASINLTLPDYFTLHCVALLCNVLHHLGCWFEWMAATQVDHCFLLYQYSTLDWYWLQVWSEVFPKWVAREQLVQPHKVSRGCSMLLNILHTLLSTNFWHLCHRTKSKNHLVQDILAWKLNFDNFAKTNLLGHKEAMF